MPGVQLAADRPEPLGRGDERLECLDELAIGFTIGLVGVSIWLAVILIGAQAFFAAQVGLRLGGRLSEHARELAERLAGAALIALAVFLSIEKTI